MYFLILTLISDIKINVKLNEDDILTPLCVYPKYDIVSQIQNFLIDELAEEGIDSLEINITIDAIGEIIKLRRSDERSLGGSKIFADLSRGSAESIKYVPAESGGSLIVVGGLLAFASLFGLIYNTSYLLTIYRSDWVYKSFIFSYVEVLKNKELLFSNKYCVVINKSGKLPLMRNKLKEIVEEDIKDLINRTLKKISKDIKKRIK